MNFSVIFIEMKKSAFFLLFLPLLFAVRLSQAAELSGPQPPAPFGVFSTLSAESPEEGRSAVAFTFDQAGDPDFSRFSSQLALGVTESLELGMNIAYVDNGENGLEDIAFHIKHRFFEEGMYGPSLAYLITATASSNSELSTDGSIGLGAVASKRVGPARGYLNLIYSHPWEDDLKDEIRFSTGLDFAASHDFRLLGELLIKKSYFSDEVDHRELRVGYRFLYGNELYSTIGVGVGLDDEEPAYRIIASVSLIFPRKVRYIERTTEEGE